MVRTTEKNYQKLQEIFSKYYLLNKTNAILAWDRQVMMPKNGFALRKEQQMLLDQISNDLICKPQVKELLDNCDISRLSNLERRDLDLMKKMFIHKTAIPKNLRQEFISLGLETEEIWAEARANNDFQYFNSSFKKLVAIVRQIAIIKSEILNVTAYEALLDSNDEGRKEKDIDDLFARLVIELPPLIDKAISKQEKPIRFLKNYPVDLQEKLGLEVIKHFGFNKSWCRADESLHPFSSSEPGDARITTRYYKDDFLSGLMAFIHEIGHALYDNHRPKSKMLKAVGQYQGMALHESQSLFLEMQIGRSRAFCEFLAPKMQNIFNLDQEICSPQNLFHQINRVKRSYIRVDADEMTYPLHVILRYQIEKQLIYGEIETDDLEEVWNEKLKTLLDLKAPTVSQGVLQDIHWADGTFGYFPTYSLGAIYSSMIAKKVKELIPDFNNLIAKGDFMEILDCLKHNIHLRAATDNADAIIKNFCGKSLDSDIFIDYLKEKYC